MNFYLPRLVYCFPLSISFICLTDQSHQIFSLPYLRIFTFPIFCSLAFLSQTNQNFLKFEIYLSRCGPSMDWFHSLLFCRLLVLFAEVFSLLLSGVSSYKPRANEIVTFNLTRYTGPH